MKTWSVGELIEKLQTFPSSTQVYLEDADTNWTIHLFEIVGGHTEHNTVISQKAVLLRPSGYDQIDSSLEFNIEVGDGR